MFFNHRILLILIGIALFYLFYFNLTVQHTKIAVLKPSSLPSSSLVIERRSLNGDDGFFACGGDYVKQCLDLFDALLHPNRSLFPKPPAKFIPADMLNEFTQSGAMPIRSYSYMNEASSSADSKTTKIEMVDMANLAQWKNRTLSNAKLAYKSKALWRMLKDYSSEAIANKTTIVVGTQEVWIEAMLDVLNASKIITLDYARKAYPANQTKFAWYQVNDYLRELTTTRAGRIETVDTAVSFSSIEHSGLGRYGDPLNPNGDLDAMKQIHCLVKPGGKLFLGVPTAAAVDEADGDNDRGFIDFNLHRYYGRKRLALLMRGWKLIRRSRRENHHTTFVLEKIDACDDEKKRINQKLF